MELHFWRWWLGSVLKLVVKWSNISWKVCWEKEDVTLHGTLLVTRGDFNIGCKVVGKGVDLELHVAMLYKII